MEQGFTFHWEPNSNPIMTNPEGLVVELEVERNIPYLRSGSLFTQPRPARKTKCVAMSPMVEASRAFENTRTEPCVVGGEESEKTNSSDGSWREVEVAESCDLDERKNLLTQRRLMP